MSTWITKLHINYDRNYASDRVQCHTYSLWRSNVLFGERFPCDHAVIVRKYSNVVPSTLNIRHVNISVGLVSISVQLARAKIYQAISIWFILPIHDNTGSSSWIFTENAFNFTVLGAWTMRYRCQNIIELFFFLIWKLAYTKCQHYLCHSKQWKEYIIPSTCSS